MSNVAAMRFLMMLYICFSTTATAYQKLTPDEYLTVHKRSLSADRSKPTANENETAESMESCMKFEGDIKMGNYTVHDYASTVFGLHRDDPIILNSAINDANFYWPGGVVPYTLAANLNQDARNAIAGAIMGYEKNTCIKWVPKTSQDLHYIEFVSDGGCWSYVGKQPNPQQISIGNGCEKIGVVQHEMLHSVGFFHEQSRADRDTYVDILWENIRTGMEGNFKKYDLGTINHLGVEYDYDSVMHYRANSFSSNGKSTMVPKIGNPTIGQREGLSEKDLIKVNKLYNCPSSVPQCTDDLSVCNEWKSNGYCSVSSAYFELASEYCKKTCNQCPAQTATITTTPLPCVDELGDCKSWGVNGFCQDSSSYSELAHEFCKATCKLC